MLKQDISTNFTNLQLPKEINGLKEIALNLWWSYNPSGKNLFCLINPYLWKESGHNPIKLLNSLSKEELESLTKDENFMREYRYTYRLFKEYLDSPKLYQEDEALPIAYFCAEFGLHHSVPIYSGGLGFLAGDILKEASDMGLPMVGVGFMYPNGYVRQVISPDGWQQGANETIDKDNAPIERVLDENGEHLLFRVPFIEPAVYASVWKLNVGRVSLYLLDTDIEQNSPWDREISSRLYTPDLNQRLRQQIVLGIGGYRVLEILGIRYSILHLNEGHPAFALFERIRYLIEEKKLSRDEAIAQVKATSVFTTHTPLQTATDVYSFDMMSQYFSDYWQRLNMDKEQFMSFGLNPDAPQSGFNMTVLGFNLCEYRNGVSKKHAKVTQEIWKTLFNKESSTKEPIIGITNGVHLPTWLSDELQETLNSLLGDGWRLMQDEADIWLKIDELDDKRLWEIHYNNKIQMVNFIRERVRRKWSREKIEPSIAIAEGVMLDPDILTIGFARRMTEYKRPDLILYDLERLEKIINNSAYPVQIIFAGKAHPADQPGKEIIQKIFRIAQDRRFSGRIAFVEDYGEESAKYLLRGCDVWLNNPQIPMEACGTSGMKASINGTLHLSTLDGWWPEGYNGENGWAIGGEYSNNIQDANSLYKIIEEEIVPLFYTLDEYNLPHKWLKRVRASIKSISPNFGSRKMMREYLDKFYAPISRKATEWEK